MRRPLSLLIVFQLITLMFASPLMTAQTIAMTVQPAPIVAGNLSSLISRAQASGSLRVIVSLRVGFQPEGQLHNPQAVQAQRATIKRTQSAVMHRLTTFRSRLIHTFDSIPALALEVDAASLQALGAAPEVADVGEDQLAEPTLDRSNPLIGSPAAWSAGATGIGQTVAVLDTGVDKSHPFLSGKVVSEACYSSNFCPGGVLESTAPGSGVPCVSISGCYHGTHVAGIVAGRPVAVAGHGTFSGVAPDATLIAIQVFSRSDSSILCRGTTPCILTYFSDVIKGLERVLALRTSFTIAAVNMSIGGALFTSQAACDSSNAAVKAAIDNLRSVGIATIIGAGNDGASDGLTTPGCISSAISVGSTTTSAASGGSADRVSGFSNSASFLNLLAPGQSIYSALPGTGYGYLQGTSMAAPHVAGAWAVLRSAALCASVDQVLSALTTTGVPISVIRTGYPTIIKPRIQVNDARLALPTQSPSTLQFDATTYTMSENGGSATITVMRTGGCTGTVSVNYATSNGTATAGSDYTSTTGTLTFAPGQTSKSFNVPILDDTLVEGNETVNLTLSNPTGGASLGSPTTAVLTITDVEPGQLQFSAASYSVNENGGSALITVTRSSGSTGTVSVTYATSNGTATAGSDYTSTTGTLTFAPGQTSRTFSIPIFDDALVEGDETIFLSLSDPTGGASLNTPSIAILGIHDVEPSPSDSYRSFLPLVMNPGI